MGLTIEWNELTRWSLVLIPAVAVSIFWLARRKREKKEFKEAQACLNSGQYVECLKHLSKADENWSFNAANSTPKTVVQDIDRLSSVPTSVIGERVAARAPGTPVVG